MKPTPDRVALLRRQLAAERRRTDALLDELAAGDRPANDPPATKAATVPNNDVAEAFARKVAQRHGWAVPKRSTR